MRVTTFTHAPQWRIEQNVTDNVAIFAKTSHNAPGVATISMSISTIGSACVAAIDVIIIAAAASATAAIIDRQPKAGQTEAKHIVAYCICIHKQVIRIQIVVVAVAIAVTVAVAVTVTVAIAVAADADAYADATAAAPGAAIVAIAIASWRRCRTMIAVVVAVPIVIVVVVQCRIVVIRPLFVCEIRVMQRWGCSRSRKYSSSSKRI